jgi:uncharacterized protein YndB with AHSA1/START domain
VTETLQLEQHPSEVFDLLVEPERLAVFHHAFDHAERAEAGPLTVGSRLRVGARVDGRPGDLELEVVALRAPELIELVGHSDDVRTRTRVEVREVDGGTEVAATTRADVDDDGDERAVEPEANPAFADLGGSLLRGIEAALTERPSQEP